MRQLRWVDDTPIVVYVLPSKHAVHNKFSKNVLKLFPYQLDRIWNRLTFSGLGDAPRVVKSQTELIIHVMNTPGAIGYAEIIDNEADVNVINITQ